MECFRKPSSRENVYFPRTFFFTVTTFNKNVTNEMSNIFLIKEMFEDNLENLLIFEAWITNFSKVSIIQIWQVLYCSIYDKKKNSDWIKHNNVVQSNRVKHHRSIVNNLLLPLTEHNKICYVSRALQTAVMPQSINKA